jgi:hypothetical protein
LGESSFEHQLGRVEYLGVSSRSLLGLAGLIVGSLDSRGHNAVEVELGIGLVFDVGANIDSIELIATGVGLELVLQNVGLRVVLLTQDGGEVVERGESGSEAYFLRDLIDVAIDTVIGV